MISSTVSGITRTNTYDGDGLLRSRTEGTATSAYLWDTAVAPAPLRAATSLPLLGFAGELHDPSGLISLRALVRPGGGAVHEP